MLKINSELLIKATGCDIQTSEFDSLGMADAKVGNRILTFIDHSKYAAAVNGNDKIKGLFVREADSKFIRSDIEKIVVDDPKWFFFSVVNYLGENRIRNRSVISSSSKIHKSAVIAEYGVIIGDNVVIEPNVVVMPDVSIGNNVKIRAGVVLGVDGYEHKNTNKGILSVTHDGILLIEDHVEVGVNSFVAKGFSYRPTIIGAETKIDALVHYAHGVQCGKRCLIVANAMIGGNVTIGNDVWIGPSSSIANRLEIGDGAFVTIGSVVTRDVAPGQKVTGNFAIPHHVFLSNLKKSVSND